MKDLLVLIAILCLSAGWSFPNAPKKDQLTLTVQLSDCEQLDSIYLFEFNGINFNPIQASPIHHQKASFVRPQTTPRFYYLGLSTKNMKPLILGPEKHVTVKASCSKFQNATFEKSTLNQDYITLREQIIQLKGQSAQHVQEYRRNINNPKLVEEVVFKMGQVDKRRLQLLDSLKQSHPYLAQVVALNTYLSFQNYGDEYANEVTYFADQYFEQADWSDPTYNYQPWVYESWKAYVETLSNIGLQPEPHRKFIEQQLARIPTDSRTYQLALGAIVTSLQQKPHPNYAHFARLFVDKYKDSVPLAANDVQAQLNRMQAFLVGGTAPNFTQNDPDGNPVSLADFRGKVVLIDFWASWCGPCRRENPNVVRLYKEYHDQGFEILGVSLDKTKDRWLNAIESDGLTWPQVSDLKGWSNEVAKQYGVRSIPHTILLDEEGKILARNLRGDALEQKLAEIFSTDKPTDD
jgi:peroxiredoxin